VQQHALICLQLYIFLKRNHYRGVMLADDIHFSDAMASFWYNVVQPQERVDLTPVGHFSGSGLIDFAENVDVINSFSDSYG